MDEEGQLDLTCNGDMLDVKDEVLRADRRLTEERG